MKVIRFFGLFLAVSNFVFCQNTEVTKSSPCSWKLASIDYGDRSVPNNLIREWELQLNRLVAKSCANPSRVKCYSETRIGDMLVMARKILNDGNQSRRDLMSVARAVDMGIPPEGLVLLDFSTVISTVIFREQRGMSPIIKDTSVRKPVIGFK